MPIRALAIACSLVLVSCLTACAGKVAESSSGHDSESGGASGSSSGGAASGDGVTTSSGAAASGTLAASGAASGATTSSGSASSGSAASGDGVSVDASACFDSTGFDSSCKQDSDCVAVYGGPICPGYTCICPGGLAINTSEQARYDAALSQIPEGQGSACDCLASAAPKCLGGSCVVCSGFPSDPPACHTTAPDAGPDGGACLQVDVTTYDQSCQTAQDCMQVSPGPFCAGACTCGGAAINTREGRRYMDTIGQAGGSILACPCAAPRPVGCVKGVCTVCEYGSTTCP